MPPAPTFSTATSNALFDPVQQYRPRARGSSATATQFYGWHYPPFFLFAAAALALMPYGLALAVWQAVTLGLYLLAIRGDPRVIPGPAPQEPGNYNHRAARTGARSKPLAVVVMDSGQPLRGFRNDG